MIFTWINNAKAGNTEILPACRSQINVVCKIRQTVKDESQMLQCKNKIILHQLEVL